MTGRLCCCGLGQAVDLVGSFDERGGDHAMLSNVSAMQWAFIGVGVALECLLIWAWRISPQLRDARNRQG
jgi:hypothetical protein